MRQPQYVEQQPTIEARAETKFTLVMPCKEVDDEVNYRVPHFFVSKCTINPFPTQQQGASNLCRRKQPLLTVSIFIPKFS